MRLRRRHGALWNELRHDLIRRSKLRCLRQCVSHRPGLFERRLCGRVLDREDRMRRKLRRHRDGSGQLRKLRHLMRCDADVHGRAMYLSLRTNRVRGGMCRHEHGFTELRRLRAGMFVHRDVSERDLHRVPERQMRVSGGHPLLYERVRRHADGSEKLRRVRDRVRGGNAMHRRPLSLPEWDGALRELVYQHRQRPRELRLLRRHLRTGRILQQWRLYLLERAGGLLRRMQGHALRLSELR